MRQATFNMTDTQDTSPSFLNSAFRIIVVLGLLSIAISLAGRIYGDAIVHGGNSSSLQTHEIVIANSVLRVPENMIRHSDQRTQGVKAKLDLYARWPAMTGYSKEDRAVFDAAAGNAPELLFITLEPRQMSRDMNGRFEPIYKQLIEPEGQAEQILGMRSYAFLKERVIFTDERLYVVETAEQAEPVFVARCIAGTQSETALAPCERDIALTSDVSIKYRFPKQLLAEYGVLDQRILALVSGFEVKAE
jgi:hypothetical protein